MYNTEVKRAQAKIHSMSLRLYESKHDTLYTIFKPFIKNQARKVGWNVCMCVCTSWLRWLNE